MNLKNSLCYSIRLFSSCRVCVWVCVCKLIELPVGCTACAYMQRPEEGAAVLLCHSASSSSRKGLSLDWELFPWLSWKPARPSYSAGPDPGSLGCRCLQGFPLRVSLHAGPESALCVCRTSPCNCWAISPAGLTGFKVTHD